MKFPHKELNGIFRYLFTKKVNIDQYYSLYNISVDSIYESSYYHGPLNSFDFDNSSAWFSSQKCGPNPWLSFCFIHNKVKLTGFEIQNSGGTCLVTEFLFGGSNDNSCHLSIQ